MRQPTEAQRQAARERRDRMKELSKKISAMSDSERAAIVERVGAVLTIERRPLSFFNSCMILTQAGPAPVSVVGGFQQWRKAGRCVMKGAHGYAIWIPTKKKQDAGTSEAVEIPAADGEAKEKKFFVLGTVFDISQTQEQTATTPQEAETC